VHAAGYAHSEPDWEPGVVSKITTAEANTALKVQERHVVLSKEGVLAVIARRYTSLPDRKRQIAIIMSASSMCSNT
jgi:hypothetical protein